MMIPTQELQQVLKAESLLASTEHRFGPRRDLGGGALPGQGLVVRAADRGMVRKTYLCEDGYAHERDKVKVEVSSYYVGLSTSSSWCAMELFTESVAWIEQFVDHSPKKVAITLNNLARQVYLREIKYPRGAKRRQSRRASGAKDTHSSSAQVVA